MPDLTQEQIEAMMPPLVEGSMYDQIVPQSWAWGNGQLDDGTKLHVLEIRSALTCVRLVLTDDALSELADQARQRTSGLKVARLETIKGP